MVVLQMEVCLVLQLVLMVSAHKASSADRDISNTDTAATTGAVLAT